MKKFSAILFFFLAFFVVSLAQTSAQDTARRTAQTEDQNGPPKLIATGRFGKNLIIYFSQTGNTEKLAQTMKQVTGGDLIKIETQEKLPDNEKELIEMTTNLKKAGTNIKVKTPHPDVSGYDFIFVGSPVWFGDVAEPTAAFLVGMDFMGKKVIAFGTSGSGPGQAYDHLTKILTNAQVLEGGQIFTRRMMQSPGLEEEVSAWLLNMTLE
ncbi:MAG: hypothetical protein LBP22_15975 [Deltaproteobacteria bacterium]|nr:hypothetical protein [Deltaproteobacteria bacterium]